MELTMAVKRSSWARSALSTCQTTRKRLLSASALDGDSPAGTATGKIIYPYFFPSDLRVTRPTDWTTSTTDERGCKNRTASSAGTSTPSERQRTFVKMRHSLSAVGALSHASLSLRVSAFIPPSTWRTATPRSRLLLPCPPAINDDL